MPATYPVDPEQIIDEEFHPLDPQAALPLEPAQMLGPEGSMYKASYWSDLKQVIGLGDSNLNLRENVIYAHEAPRDFLERNIGGGIEGLKIGGEFAAFGLAGGGMMSNIVGGTFGSMAVGAAYNISGLSRYQDELGARGFSREIGQLVGRGTGSTLSGHGFTREENKDLARFTIDAAERFGVNIEDIQTEMAQFSNAGLLAGSNSVEEFKKNFASMKKNITNIIKVLGTTQEEAVQLMSELNNQGIFGKSAMGGVNRAMQASSRTGVAVSAFMDAGMSTAQAFQGTGVSGGAGFNTGINNMSAATFGAQTGDIGRGTIFQLGGVDNMAFEMTQTQMSWLNSPTGDLSLRAAMDKNGGIKMQDYLRVSQLSHQEQLSLASSNMQNGGYDLYMANQNAIKSQVLAQAPQGLLNANIMSDLTKMYIGSGGDPSTMNYANLKATAMKQTGFAISGDMFDAMSGSMTALSPEYLASQNRLAYEMNEEQRRRYQRQDSKFARGVNAAGDALIQTWSPVDRVLDGIANNTVNSLDKFAGNYDSWYQSKVKGIDALTVTKDDIDYIMKQAGAGRDVLNYEPVTSKTGFFADYSYSQDAGELAVSTLARRIYDPQAAGVGDLNQEFINRRSEIAARQRAYKAANGGRLPEGEVDIERQALMQTPAYRNDPTAISTWMGQDAIYAKALASGDQGKIDAARSAIDKRRDAFEASNAYSMDMPEDSQMFEQLQKLGGYDQAAAYQDTGLGGKTVIVKDVREIDRQLSAMNQVASSAATYFGLDQKKRDASIERLEKSGQFIKTKTEVMPDGTIFRGPDIGFRDIRGRMEGLSSSERAEFAKIEGADQKMRFLFNKMDIDVTATAASGGLTAATYAVLQTAEWEATSARGLRKYDELVGMKNVSIGSNVSGIRDAKAAEKGQLDSMIEGFNDTMGWFNKLDDDSETFLRSTKGQSLLQDYMDAQKSGDQNKVDDARRKILDTGGPGIRPKLSKLLDNPKNTGDIINAMTPAFGRDDTGYSDFEVRQYAKTMPRILKGVFSKWSGGNSPLSKFADDEEAGLKLMSDIEKGKGISIEDLSMSMGKTAGRYSKYMEDGTLSPEERESLANTLIGSRSGDGRDNIIAYSYMDQGDFDKVDDRIQRNVRLTVARKLKQIGVPGADNLVDDAGNLKKGVTESQLKKLAGFAAGSMTPSQGDASEQNVTPGGQNPFQNEVIAYISAQTTLLQTLTEQVNSKK